MNRRQFLKATTSVSFGLSAATPPLGADTAEKSSGTPSTDVRMERFYDPPKTPSGIFVAAPSTVGVGEEFTVGVKMTGKPYTARANCFTEAYPTVESSTNLSPRGTSYMDNVPVEWTGVLEIDGKGYAGPEIVRLGREQGLYPHDRRPISRVGPVHFKKPGVHFLTFRDPMTGLTALSNPIQVSAHPPTERLYWGDIHGHTILTDAIRSPEEYYFFGRDEAFLDVCALSEHAEFYITPRQWEYMMSVSNDFNEAGHFVTLLAQEWTSKEFGHRNLYYKGGQAPLVRATDPAWSEISSIYKLAREHGALVVPHHSASSAMGVDWSKGHDPEVERLVEVFSCWGSSERSGASGNPRPIHEGLGGELDGQHVSDALRLGRRFGLIGSGDVHDGRPGDTLNRWQAEPANYRHTQRGGLVGIWCQSLTRENVFDAFWNRRVFATTGARIFLKFAIAGRVMGSSIKNTGALPVEIEVVSEIPITRVDIVKTGEDFMKQEPNSRTATWTFELPPQSGTHSYFVRVTRADGEMAWSSPIWIEE